MSDGAIMTIAMTLSMTIRKAKLREKASSEEFQFAAVPG